MKDLPKLRDGCRFYPYDGARESAEYVVCTPEERQFRISALTKDILDRLDGSTDLREVSRYLSGRDVSLSPAQLKELVEQRYAPMGVFENCRAQDGKPDKLRNAVPLLLHWDLLPREAVLAVSRPLAALFNRLAVLPGLVAIAASHYFVYTSFNEPAFLTKSRFLPVLGLCLLSVLMHEFGHTAAVARYGGRPGRIGFGLYILMPSFYADVSQIWRFPRRQRMVVDIGGVYFHQLAFAGLAAIGYLSRAPEFFVVCRFIDLMSMLALNPVFRFDGYWLLADWLGLPNLFNLALGHLKRILSQAFGGRHPGSKSDLPQLRRHAYWIFTFYALFCNVFLVLILFFGYSYVKSVFTSMPLVFSTLFESMLYALKARDLLLAAERLLTLFFAVAFPATIVVGLCRYALNIARFLAGKLRPARRPAQSGVRGEAA